MTVEKPGNTRRQTDLSRDVSLPIKASSVDDGGSTIGRRQLLALLGLAALPVSAAEGTRAATTNEYGGAGYGTGGYGRSDSGGDATSESVVTTGALTDVTASSATLHGELVDDGSVDAVFFSWRESGSETWETTDAQRLESPGQFGESLEGLSGETTYEVRAVADSGDGEAFGDRREFATEPEESTDAPPVIDAFDATARNTPNPHAELLVEWDVSDVDKDIERVVIDVTDASKPNTAIDSETIDASGSVDSGSRTFDIKHGGGDRFRVVLEVADGSRVRTRECEVHG